jgi:Xaa-Pro dipeptidase
MSVPFRPYHHFNHWCPLQSEGHLLHIRPGHKPVLYFFAPADYWHEHSELGDAFWAAEFDVRPCGTEEDAWKAVKGLSGAAYLGPDREKAHTAGLRTEVQGLLPRLNWERSFKSDYEIACTEKANKRAAKGHVAAREAFFAGGSELDIHHAYLRTIRGTDESLPYPTIVCLNEKGAVLHYHKKRDKTRMGKTFLIDAGARYKGYASDVTRSYAADDAPEEFRSLISGMQKLQQRLCGMIKPGLSYLLGILVHDVAGKVTDRLGTPSVINPKHKYLRTNRILDAGMLVTVEPGLYFIEMLLRPMREGQHRASFDWALVDRLASCGGIRIEDDVVVTRSGQRNITREYLP